MSNPSLHSDWQKKISDASINLQAADEISPHSINKRVKAEQSKNDQHAPNTQAAVLVPIIERVNTPHIILTRRSNELPSHKGQVAFPGGKIDPIDKTPTDAAIRETHEEIGIAPRQIKPLGKLPLLETGTGFIITPITAKISPPLNYRMEVGEVDEIFEVPLSHVANLQNYKRQSVIYNNLERKFWQLDYKHHYIWGATAAILIDLAIRINNCSNLIKNKKPFKPERQ